MKPIVLLSAIGILAATAVLAQPTGSPPVGNVTVRANSAWYRGGNVFAGPAGTNNIFGFAAGNNAQIWHQTNGFNRMMMDGGANGVSDGRIGFGNDLPGTFLPADRLQSYLTGTGDNFFRFSSSATTASGGVRFGLSATNEAQFDQLQNSLFRFSILGLSVSSQLTKFTIDNINQANITNAFQPAYQDVARVGIWNGGASGTALSMLHLGQPGSVNFAAHRDWMNVGTFYNSSSDGMYVGLKETDANGIDAVVAWGDDGIGAGTATDRLKFVFNADYATWNGVIPSGGANGLEVARMGCDGIDGRTLFNQSPLLPNLDPQNSVHIIGQSPNGTAATSGGNSGLRFEYLNSTTPATTNPGTGVLSVNANGDVIYVPAASGSGSVTAQNGLNTLAGPNIVELGGNLLHHTNVTTFGGGGANLAVNGTGQFAISEYAPGPSSNAAAAQLTSDYKAGIFNNSFQKTLRLENIKTVPATNAQYGEEITVDLDNTSNLWTMGEYVKVLGDGANVYGISTGALARNANATTSGVMNAIGINASGTNGYHTWGGNFTASTSVVNTINTWAHGIESNATGGNLEAIGGLFYSQGSPNWNKGVYAISRNSLLTPASKSIGVWGLADNPNANGYNLGVIGIGNEPSTANTTTAAVGVSGVIGSNSWGTNYIPLGLRAGVFGSSQFASSFGSGSLPVWAGYFNGNVFTSSSTYYTSDARLKKDIKEIEKSLDIIKKLNPVSYHFKDNIKSVNLPAEKQYGFISQEIKEILPELTKNMSHGATLDSAGNEVMPAQEILALNYNGFIAILTDGIKEQQEVIESQEEKIGNLQQQINELKQLIQTGAANPSNAGTTGSSINIDLSDKNIVVLNQNVPNPFAENTTITYNIPENTGKAQILFYSVSGQLIKAVEITEKGSGQLNVFANDLSNGIYTYTLVVDGKVIDTKKMEKQR
ncbi:MAG: Collagen triple helix repeat-containing protein [Bacteroidetes bacterium]|nr:MAG: Collagen triple helix repeat-containing protein [Bacteroidota bacterium]